MKAILVNPKSKKITEVDVDDFNSIKKHIGCRCISGVDYIKPDGKSGDFEDDYIYTDDEGMFADNPAFVKIPGIGQEFFAGSVVITGSDGEGGNAPVKMTLEQAKKIFQFPTLSEVIRGAQ